RLRRRARAEGAPRSVRGGERARAGAAARRARRCLRKPGARCMLRRRCAGRGPFPRRPVRARGLVRSRRRSSRRRRLERLLVVLSDKGDLMTARPELGSWQDWARQRLVFTEAVRGGPLVWPAGGEHLAGDPLGPVRHAHDDAAEYYFVLSGECLIEVGGEERVATTNELVFIPANAPHNLL